MRRFLSLSSSWRAYFDYGLGCWVVAWPASAAGSLGAAAAPEGWLPRGAPPTVPAFASYLLATSASTSWATAFVFSLARSSRLCFNFSAYLCPSSASVCFFSLCTVVFDLSGLPGGVTAFFERDFVWLAAASASLGGSLADFCI